MNSFTERAESVLASAGWVLQTYGWVPGPGAKVPEAETRVIADNNLEPDIFFSGATFGVALEPRGVNDDHLLFEVYIGDDEHWNRKLSASSFWIDDLITQLKKAKDYMSGSLQKDPNGYGYILKKKAKPQAKKPVKRKKS